MSLPASPLSDTYSLNHMATARVSVMSSTHSQSESARERAQLHAHLVSFRVR